MKYLNFAFLFLLLPLHVGCKKNNASLDEGQIYSIDHGYDAKKEELWVEVKMGKKVHAYGVGETVGKPISLKVAEENGWKKIAEPILPSGKKVNNSMIIEGDFKVRQPLKRGTGQTLATFDIQICSNNNCYRPQAHEFLIN